MISTQQRRGSLKIMLFVLLCVFTLAAMGSSCMAQKKITLTVWWWGEQEAPGLAKWMDETVELFEIQHPNVTVNAVLQQTETLYPAFRSAAAAGVGPDVQFLWPVILNMEDVWAGNIAPISDYWSDEQLNVIPPSSRAETFWNGKQWGVPFFQNGGYAWAYNKKFFGKAGLDSENPPTEWDDFLEAGRKLKEVGITPMGGGSKDGWIGVFIISYLAKQTLDSFEDLANAVIGKESFTEPKHIAWWYKFDELVKEEMWNIDVSSLDFYQGMQLFPRREVAITCQMQPGLVNYEREMGSDVVGVMMTPIFGEGKLAKSFGVASHNLNISSFSKHKELAAEFIWFIHTKDRMKAMYEIAGAICPDTRFDQSWLTTKVDMKIQKWILERQKFWYQLYYPLMLESDAVIPAVQNIFAQRWTPEQAGQKMDEVIKKWRKMSPKEVDIFKGWYPFINE